MATTTTDFQALEEFGGAIQQSIMPIITGNNGKYWPLGTGFMIGADGLMMTATHVLREAYLKGTGSHAPAGASTVDMELYALYLTNEQHGPNNEFFAGGLWPIDKIWFSEELDIAFCWLRSATKNDVPLKFPVVKLSPGLPTTGQNIVGFGYYKMENETSEYTAEKIELKYSQNTAFTKGIIQELHPLGRDNCMLKFPVFHTDARFDGGMSGGPIFNESGAVCGVICSSMPPFEDGSKHISYDSLIYPVMGSAIEVAINGNGNAELVPIHKLIEMGYIAVDETYEKIEVINNGNGTLTVKIRV